MAKMTNNQRQELRNSKRKLERVVLISASALEAIQTMEQDGEVSNELMSVVLSAMCEIK